VARVPGIDFGSSSPPTLITDDEDLLGISYYPFRPHRSRPHHHGQRKPTKGILKQPRPQFPEEPNPIREGVAPLKNDKKKADMPAGARWTKINRALVEPEALELAKERFEVREEFVIVLRVLSTEEIKALATSTRQLRGRFDYSDQIVWVLTDLQKARE
jgi:hypothetical protein